MKVNYCDFLLFGIMLCMTFVFIDGFFPQLQMIVFSGDIPISNYLFKLLPFVLFFLLLLLRQRLNYVSGYKYTAFFLIFFFSYIFVLLFFRDDIPSSLLGYNSYYYYMFFFLVSLFVKFSIRARTMELFFQIASIITCLLGLLQFVFEEPLLYLVSNDGTFSIMSHNFFDIGGRIFSFFSSALGFGYFLIFSFYLHLYFWLDKSRSALNRTYSFFMLFVILVCVYGTFTRNIYLAFLLSLIPLFLRSVLSSKKMVLYFPAVIIFIVCFSAGFLELFLSFSRDSGQLSTASLFQRVYFWGQAIDFWLGNHFSIERFFFGVGLIQNEALNPNFIVDNMYLAVAVNVGVIGLFLFLLIWISFWSTVVNLSFKINSPIINAITITFSSSFIMLLLNNSSMLAYFMVFAVFATSSYEYEQKRTIKI